MFNTSEVSVVGLKVGVTKEIVDSDFINKKKKALLKLIELASEVLSHRGCSDISSEILNIFSEKELIEIDNEINIWNSSPDDHHNDFSTNFDWLWLRFLGDDIIKIKED